MGFSANLLMPTCGGVKPVPVGMLVENFNVPADVNGDLAQSTFCTYPVGLESYPSAGVVQLNGQIIYAILNTNVQPSLDFYFEVKFFGPAVPVFFVCQPLEGYWAASSKWEVDFGAITNPLPTVAHVVMGRQAGVNCAWLNGQKVSPTFTDALAAPSDYIFSGTFAAPYQNYTLDALRFAVGTYYDPAAATIPVPVGDLTW